MLQGLSLLPASDGGRREKDRGVGCYQCTVPLPEEGSVLQGFGVQSWGRFWVLSDEHSVSTGFMKRANIPFIYCQHFLVGISRCLKIESESVLEGITLYSIMHKYKLLLF